MHYSIRYNHPSPAVNDANAIRDAMEYMGEEGWTKTFALFIQPGSTFRKTPYSVKKKIIQQVRFCCMLAGIRGYTVGAILRGIWAAHR